MAALILATAHWLRTNRPPLDLRPGTAAVRWEAADVGPMRHPKARLAGAWELKSDDPHAGGFSGLALDRGRLLVLTDEGMLIWLPTPGHDGNATLRPLPAVSGNPRTKIGRDSEALMRDPGGRGWWVAFEQRHQLIHYDDSFEKALERVDVARPEFRRNRGVEALSSDGGIRWYAESSGVSDAASLAAGGTLFLRRRAGPAGFSARVTGPGDLDIALPVGPLDNAEGLAVESLPGAGPGCGSSPTMISARGGGL
ncbi:esterase-like activity of phytase family protein [Sphingomonas sp. HDW15A]|uniref:esterase-like activity of phytase family protein n=1 Tax=Sphingomonas sp. HDW15A TaxID=2714942 RepID=UPI001409BB06|nr:esterase-like activity of phytase family protein [Sphingomonas sp. HDW15A]QIK96815.1 esterase-like activity of phytase family protein [Sphingomonas sp. HDW15A]